MKAKLNLEFDINIVELILIGGTILGGLLLAKGIKRKEFEDAEYYPIDEDYEIDGNLMIKIEDLESQYRTLEESVANELVEVLGLLHTRKVKNALHGLVKIIEDQMKKMFFNDDTYIDWAKKNKKNRKVFNSFIDFAKSIQFIDEIEHQFLIGVKNIRNKIVHEVDVKFDKHLIETGFVASIGTIVKLGQKKLQDKNNVEK